MRIQLLGSTVGDPTGYQFCMSYLINETIAIDAGSLGLQSPISVQQGVSHLLLSHAHLDHIATLPIWLDNVFEPSLQAPRIYASSSTWDFLQRHILNDSLWPNLERVAASEAPFYYPEILKPEQPVEIAGLTITPVDLDHLIPTFGFLIDDGQVAIALISDTSPTTRIWELCRQHPRLKAVFLEASFPNRMAWLAEKTKHLTPAMAFAELEKLGREDIPVYFVHLKPQHQVTMSHEVLSHQTQRPVIVVDPGHEYVISL
ncbi:3',5'-cyclic-nucleotide phosphodiesterase [bacterium]|nr:3',5'-cyclic-nucleotide phosphodiesterase [bacterium]